MIDRLLLECFTQSHWALEETRLRNLHAILVYHAIGRRRSPDEIEERTVRRSDGRPPARPLCLQHHGRGTWVEVPGSSLGYEIVGGIAVVHIAGVIARHAATVRDISEPAGVSCEEIKLVLADLEQNEAAQAVLLSFDSPGGSVEGIAEISDWIFELEKTTIAQVNETMASAAYWLGSQADAIYIPVTGQAGSIGVYGVLEDSSRLFAEDFKIDVHLIKAGAFKGIGTPGVAVTPEQLEPLQAGIDETYRVFVEHVARGLEISEDEALELADGAIAVGRTAVDLGLASGIRTFDQTLSQMIDEFGTGDAGGLRLAQ